MHICQFCNSVRKSKISLVQHEIRCERNPEKIEKSKGFSGHHHTEYTKNYLKVKCKRLCTEEIRKKLSDANKARSKEFNIANGNKIREAVKKKVEEGTWHTSLARKMHFNYKGVDLHGSWELKYAQYLDANNICWERCKESFPYEFEGKIRRYTPDFFLIETQEYVEIKGYKTSKDAAKWSQFPEDKVLKVFLEKDLRNIGII